MATVSDVRQVAHALPYTTEGFVRDHRKFRVGRIVYAAVSPDERQLGFGFPKEQRAGLVAADPVKFVLPSAADLRYNWVESRLAELDRTELAELLLDAWCIVVSAKRSAAFLATLPADWPRTVYGY
ncbi:MAG TPA: MmcQ/YjbR family DNA-binding protein [Jatrophihabitans sp.]|nr:MmcQ/YjbR family DNA-binding protein [Jatrophihabitans sp.]